MRVRKQLSAGPRNPRASSSETLDCFDINFRTLLPLGNEIKFGWGNFITSEPRYPHEILELTYPGHGRISKKAIELYEKGHSIAETAAMVGMPATSLFEGLKARSTPMRPAWKVRKTNPSYGYAWLSGEIVMNPLEYKTVLLIMELFKMGKRPHQIAGYLNEQGIKPRRGKKWFARTVTDIIRRQKLKDSEVIFLSPSEL